MSVPDSRCAKRIYGRGRSFNGSRCARDAVRDGFCSQHHPDAEKARRAKSDKEQETRMVALRRRWRVEAAEREVINAALAADRAGHQWNNRGVCEAVGVLRSALEGK